MATGTTTVGIVSIGVMGLGFAKLLLAHKYEVATFAADRSQATQDRARTAGVQLSPTMEDLLKLCDYILSIVPPRDALATAERVTSAARSIRREHPLYYLDLNAISPQTARDVEVLIQKAEGIRLVDGGIIGGVPRPKDPPTGPVGRPNWHCPACIVSGPHQIPDQNLAQIMNVRHIGSIVGSASGLKMCFAATTKGYYAIAIESFTTAHQLGILGELRHTMAEYNPAALKMADYGVISMPPKAYRWVGEMREIANTLSKNGGFDSNLFDAVSEVYRVIAEDTVLGKETPGRRTCGTDVNEAVELIARDMEEKKKSNC